MTTPTSTATITTTNNSSSSSSTTTTKKKKQEEEEPSVVIEVPSPSITDDEKVITTKDQQGVTSTSVSNTTNTIISTHNNSATKKWQSPWDHLQESRAYKLTLVQQGVKGRALWEAMATRALDHKISALLRHQKCPTCWHSAGNCICASLQALASSLSGRIHDTDIQLLVVMHHKEYLSGGNSAKLLLTLFPNHTQLYLYGKQGEVERLRQDISGDTSCLLWPSETAMSVHEWIQQMEVNNENHDEPSNDNPTNSAHSSSSSSTPIFFQQQQQQQAMVLDGTYCQARNMHSSLQKLWGHANMPPTVKLSPVNDSVFHRAQKNYGQAHQQQPSAGKNGNDKNGNKNCATTKRVSTAEACGLFLTEMGVDPQVEHTIVQAVQRNNQALQYARTSTPNKKSSPESSIIS